MNTWWYFLWFVLRAMNPLSFAPTTAFVLYAYLGDWILVVFVCCLPDKWENLWRYLDPALLCLDSLHSRKREQGPPPAPPLPPPLVTTKMNTATRE